MGHRRWYKEHEEQEAIKQAQAQNRFVWVFTKRNVLRETMTEERGYYVGWRKPIKFLRASITSKLIYTP